VCNVALRKETIMFYGRSPDEIRDDMLCEEHSQVEKDLDRCASGRFIYTGAARLRLITYRDWLETAIKGEVTATSQQIQWRGLSAYRCN
jgi:uncharacterized caspase-like protein